MFFRDENIFGMQIIEKQYNKNIAKNMYSPVTAW